MYIDPVIPDFQYVKIRRSGGIMGVRQELHVDGNLEARVQDSFAGNRAFNLDAYTSSELMNALARLQRDRPGPSTAKGCDFFHYDIELSAGGQVYRISSVDLGADEALHGVMFAANRLIEGDPFPIHPMSLHTQAHVEPTPA